MKGHLRVAFFFIRIEEHLWDLASKLSWPDNIPKLPKQ